MSVLYLHLKGVNMGQKYVIELEDKPFHKNGSGGKKTELYRVKGFNSLVFDGLGLSKLKPYEDCEKDFEAGVAYCWEIIKQLSDTPLTKRNKLFNKLSMHEIVFNYTPERVKYLLGTYEEKFDVGDEVRFEDGSEMFKAVIIDHANADDDYYVLNENGCIQLLNTIQMEKTGRKYPIDVILADMRCKK